MLAHHLGSTLDVAGYIRLYYHPFMWDLFGPHGGDTVNRMVYPSWRRSFSSLSPGVDIQIDEGGLSWKSDVETIQSRSCAPLVWAPNLESLYTPYIPCSKQGP